jgi:excisionase family DNA binding protein
LLADYLRAAARSGEVVDLTTRAEALTPSQIAARLSTSRPSVMRLIRAGELGAYQVGTHWRVPAREFDRFLAQRHARMIHAISADLEADLDAG